MSYRQLLRLKGPNVQEKLNIHCTSRLVSGVQSPQNSRSIERRLWHMFCSRVNDFDI